MTSYKVIHLTADGAVGYREDKPDNRRMGSAVAIDKWLSSGEKLEWASEEQKQLTLCYIRNYKQLLLFSDNITTLVELKRKCGSNLCGSDTCNYICHAKPLFLYFNPAVVEEENQRLYAENIISAITSNHSKTHEEIIEEILKHYKITRL